MPAHQRLWLYDGHRLQDRREPAIKQNEEEPIAIREPNTSVLLALQDCQLKFERRILCRKLALRPGWQHQQSQQEDEQGDHCRVTLRDSVAGSNGRSFRHTQLPYLVASIFFAMINPLCRFCEP
jgi:hypothetical protein